MIIPAIVTLVGLGLIFGIVLAFASTKFTVKVDERLEEILQTLPGTNCGGCGFAGCQAFAEALLSGRSAPNDCKAGGMEVDHRLGDILDLEVETKEREVAIVLCRGGKDKVTEKFIYRGVEDCRAALLLGGGSKECAYGCLGLGTCARICPFDAIRMGEDRLPIIDKDKCTGCGKCVDVCPRKVIALVPRRSNTHVLCLSHQKGAIIRKVCRVGCTGCGKCIKVCPMEAITLEDNLARIDYEKCNDCGRCIEACPTGSIVLVSGLPNQVGQ